MKRFYLNRREDQSGVSGTGIVAEGVVFSSGKVALAWRTKHTSIAIYDNIETLEAIHGHGGATIVEWVESEPYRAPWPVRDTLGNDKPDEAPCARCKGEKFIECDSCTGCGCVVCAGTKRVRCPDC